MRDRTYWKSHYVLESNADEIERSIKITTFTSNAKSFELVHFVKSDEAPNILISQGSGGHAYVFAELGYQLHLRGYNVFIMPKHGGFTISELIGRELDAINYIKGSFCDRVGVFGEGLGGFVTFYLALAHGPIMSIALQNAPAVLTEETFQEAVLRGDGASKQNSRFLPVLRFLDKIVPLIKFPISLYLNWKDLIDPKEENFAVEEILVKEGYLRDPDFDRWYPVSAIMSLLSTPPPNSIAELEVPTMLMVAQRGFGGKAYASYLKELYARMPAIKKKIVDIDGSVYWMLSHPKEAARIIGDWFVETL